MYLRHEPTGDVYPYNAELALRGDMTPVEDAKLDAPTLVKKPKRTSVRVKAAPEKEIDEFLGEL